MKPTIFERHYEDEDGTKSIWKYNLLKHKNGPIETTVIYPKNYKAPSDILKEKNKKLPKNKQKFINPKNGKFVAYQRAKILGLVK